VATFNYPLPDVKMLRSGGAWVINYGYHTQDDVFYVHVADIELLGGWFIPQEQNVQRSVTLPTRIPTAQAVPRQIASMPADLADEPVEQSRSNGPIPTEPEFDFDLQILPGISSTIAASMVAINLLTPADIIEGGAKALRTITGVGKVKADAILAGAAEYLAQATATVPSLEEELESLTRVL